MRVLILYTGGTFGMLPSAQGYVPSPGLQQRLLQQLPASQRLELPEFDLLEMDRLIDSSNLVPADWVAIGQPLLEHWDDYSGFVVIHGTDTMAYTASALSFMLRGLDKPVIVTGSQIPLAALRNDAWDNLLDALLLVANHPEIREVCLLFNGRLLRGNRSVKVSSDRLAAFASPNFPYLGEIGIGIKLNTALLLPPQARDFCLPVFDPASVLMLGVYPGMPAELLASALANPAVRGLVLRTYGAGNPPDANQAWMAALSAAASRGVVIVNVTQCQSGQVSQGTYATGAALNRMGVIPGSDMTAEAAFSKLHVLLGKGLEVDAVATAMRTALCGEHDQS